ncbi:hypothetical protein DSL92_01495 [Billgrantia gudaonensis]|uniref:Methyl-accepting transducer domain-containing protein n=1 Tax=Billgrantia gudaonensis TaxID=376427 RepID=A0A432JKK2_9GAMM|nr:hypothetical protein DSL92_01495 [Halomonas gudaonensis]
MYKDIREGKGRYGVKHGQAIDADCCTCRAVSRPAQYQGTDCRQLGGHLPAHRRARRGHGYFAAVAATAALWLAASGVAALCSRRSPGGRQHDAPLAQIRPTIALQFAAGNLKADLPSLGTRNELSRMLGSLNFMRQSSTLIGDLNRRVDVVNPAVAGLIRNNDAMASRLEQQASSVQETAASTEQISATNQSAEHAQQEFWLGRQRRSRGQSRRHHAGAAASMQAITRQAENMAGIVGTIDAIAFQTNILALNGPVEAARAGEHGRGFAVVAQEVRKLASQSADAAHRVQSLITRHAKRSRLRKSGRRGANRHVPDQTGQPPGQRPDGELSAAAAEQSQGIGQISRPSAKSTRLPDQREQHAELPGGHDFAQPGNSGSVTQRPGLSAG